MPPDRERNFDEELRDLGPRVEYPPTPDLARSVRGRLDAEARHAAPPTRGPSLWWVAAAVFVGLLALPALYSGFMISGAGGGGMAGGAGGQGGGGEEVRGEQEDAAERSPTVPVSEAQKGAAMSGGASSSAGDLAARDGSARGGVSGASGEGLGLGEKISFGEARARAEGPILLPRFPELGKPDGSYASRDYPGLTFLYRERARLPGLGDTDIGLLLTQTPGGVEGAYLPRGSVEMRGIEKVNVGDSVGYWIPPSGDSPEVARSGGLLAGVLLWERNGQALRLEAEIPKNEAARIAESVR